MPKPSEYLHLRAWGMMMGSYEYYIKAQQELAAEENAPLTSMYKNSDGIWQTYESITRADTVRAVDAQVERLLKTRKVRA